MRIFLKLLLIITLFSCTSNPQKNLSVWTAEYEKKWRSQISNEIAPRLPDNEKREALVSYIVQRLKEELPNGVESVSTDSVNRLSSKIGKEYAYKHVNEPNTGLIPSMQPWSKKLEDLFIEVLMKDAPPDKYAQQKKLCDCALKELKAIYPDSVMIPFPKEAVQQTAITCISKESNL